VKSSFTAPESRLSRPLVPLVVELPPEVDVPRALERLAKRRRVCAIDSAAGEPRRCGVVAFDPHRELLARTADGDPLAALAAGLATMGPPEADLPGPFAGGFLGALAYDVGVRGERPVDCAPEPWGFPDLVGGVYGDFLVRDEQRGRSWLVLDAAERDDRPPVEHRREELRELLLAAPAPAAVDRGPVVGSARRHVERDEHMQRIEAVRRAIAAGDLYQANLAHRLTSPTALGPLELYLRLRAVNPAPYMGYCAWHDRDSGAAALLSASPELLFEFDGRRARTRPIKGTAARSPDPDEDRASAARLLASDKDLAELTMIVDLERNDLGRICVPGGVRVEGCPTLRSYARVHHLMADVVGEVRPGVAALDVLAALFPGGSVTGAPKLASMELIARLEREGRGFFCGSLGFVDTRGRSAFNILIRTLLWRAAPGGGEVSFRVGGGITWSSEAAAEDRETLDKAAGLLDALGGSASAVVEPEARPY